jgi:hypothetical protein
VAAGIAGPKQNHREEPRSTCALTFVVENYIRSAALSGELCADALRAEHYVTGRTTSILTR